MVRQGSIIMASQVYWVREINGNQEVDPVLQRINEISDNQNHLNRKVLAMGGVLDSIRSTHDNPNEFLEQSKEQSLLHPLEFCVQIYRKHCSKSPPFCNSIYGLTDQLISLQLVMAQKNKEKSGEFEADTRDVITTHQHVIESKLYGLSSVRDPEILQIIEDYDKFLADCNAVDYADIINSVSRCFQSSDNNNTKQFYQDQKYTILGIPTTLFEIEILQLLIGARDVVLLSPSQGESILTIDKFNEIIKDSCSASKENMKQEVSRTTDPVMPSTPVHANKTQTDFQVTPHHQTGTNDRQVSVCLSGGQSPMLSQSPFSQGHRTMGQELSVVMSYLQLLVNSRDELALARVINTPDRELGVRKFTKIKRLAREKNMSMYQMVTSFILQIRLGGKSYAPSNDNPLWLMTKGLSDFVSFSQKLQNILEEVPDAKTAVTKILGNLQTSFIRATDGTISKEDVKKAITYLKTQIDSVLNSSEQTELKAEQNRNMIGSESYLLLRKLLDKNVLYDYQEKELYRSLKTPSREQGTTCSLLTKFRSPDAPTPEKVESPGSNKPNSNNENPKLQKRQGRSLYGDISLAKPTVAIVTRTSIWQNNEDDINQEHQTRKPCGMLNNGETPKSSSRKRTFGDTCDALNEKTCSPLRKRPFESKDDQENININNQPKPTAKRGLLSKNQLNECGKKKQPKTKTAPKKKQKSVKLTQGQKQMTHFFR